MTSTTQRESIAVPFLDERYELGLVLGEGSVGRVYAARDLVLGIDVAVKVMHERHVHSREVLAHFSREASLSSRMLSPHIVKALGLAITRSGAPCIVYEMLEGETLAMRLMRDGGASLVDTIEIVKQVSLALTRAHSIGVVHRDVKPDNIFLVAQPGGRFLVKLLDFGIAEVMDESGVAATCELVGTPEYIAPELLLGSTTVDARADIYALGVVAFECLTGQCPFPGANIDEVIAAAREGKRPALSELRPDLDGAIDEWTDRALNPDPYWRFSTTKELSTALQAAATTRLEARVNTQKAA